MPIIDIYPVTPDRWADLEKLFGPNGAYGGCWCMFFRLRRKESEKRSGPENKAGMKELVDSGEPPGLLAYSDGEPAGWVSLAPRESFAQLEHSRKLRRIDAQPVWSIVCFVIGRRFRRQGLMTALLQSAIDYARSQGARIVEGYPIEPGSGLSGYKGYTGIISTYRRLGFVEVARPGERQAVMRLELTADSPSG